MRRFKIKNNTDVSGLEGHKAGGVYEFRRVDANGDIWLKTDNEYGSWCYGANEIEEVLFNDDLKYIDSGLSFQELRDNVIQWAKDKNLLKPENHLKQFAKMVSEVGELGDALIKEDHPEVIDAIGDVQVCLIILCEQLGVNPTECLESAWNVIKDRTGKNLNGTFIKD